MIVTTTGSRWLEDYITVLGRNRRRYALLPCDGGYLKSNFILLIGLGKTGCHSDFCRFRGVWFIIGVLRAILDLLRLFYPAIDALYLCSLPVPLLEHAHFYQHIHATQTCGAFMILSSLKKRKTKSRWPSACRLHQIMKFRVNVLVSRSNFLIHRQHW